MKKLENQKTLIIKQKRAWGEILSGVEQCNRYIIYDESGNELYYAGESGITFFRRLFMKSMRPFEIQITDETDSIQMYVRRPYKWWFHMCSMFSADDVLMAEMRWVFQWFKRKYIILDNQGAEMFSLHGTFLKPWTFQIRKYDKTIGIISKKWSGAFKEILTDEDNFAIVFDEPINLLDKQILLGTIFLIDFIHFER